MVDIRDTGRQSDSSIYGNCNFGYSIENNLLGIPKDNRLRPELHNAGLGSLRIDFHSG